MSSQALTDLRARVLSNTLTGPQQEALASALAILAPVFPSPDELAGGIPSTEPALARDWMAPLYALNAQGGADVLPTTVTEWWIDFDTGSDTNPGTEDEPLKTNAALAALWRGTAGGGRPVLDPASGTTITVHLGADWPDTDPLAPLLDVDITDGAALIFSGADLAPAHSGTVATANAWARTAADGQVKITDAAVADFGPFVAARQLLLEDVNTGAVLWLYGPDSGSSATGTCTVGYGPQTPGAFPTVAQTAVNAGNGYTLKRLVTGPIGQGFETRTFPLEGDSGSQVFFYRVGLSNTPSLNPSVTLNSPAIGYTFQESILPATVVRLVAGSAVFANTLVWRSGGIFAQGVGTAQCIAGGGIQGQNSGRIICTNAGEAIVDQDFALISAAPFTAIGATLALGDVGYWTQGAGTHAIEVQGGVVIHLPFFGAEGIFYGAVGANIAIMPTVGGAGNFVCDSGHTAVSQFACNVSTFTCGGQASAYGFDQAAGTFTGPTTCTLAHVDAALGAGTGFGGHVVDPASGCTFSKG